MHLSRLTILLGAASATRPWTDALREAVANYQTVEDDDASSWPFRRSPCSPTAPTGAAMVVRDLDRAFPAGQTGSARLVTTQSTYQLQRWLDWLDANASAITVGVIANPSPDLLREAGARRGPWARLHVVEVARASTSSPARHALHEVFRRTDPEARYEASRRALAQAPADPAIALALGSACMETGRLDECEDALAAALVVASGWEAVHYERGKAWLRRDDTERAAAAFAEAARLMPSFAAAHANLGAALGELERPEDALAALEQAAALDPFGHAIHSNIGASLRDLGRLAEAEASFRRVLAIAPGFVFGHYNLGHVLFLQGRFAEARAAYEAGFTSDPSKTPRQRIRLALTLAAAGDGTAAATHARVALEDTPADGRAELLDEVEEVLHALTALQAERRPAVEGLKQLVADYRPPTLRS
jgi:tetratricopeptide (TPR) repeat protein